ncbi:MAG: exo-alpha-sialidase [Oscillospiraceae bacterium]|nr:exo-alpha-sialidase [Oscillospiraceae bacterium]
MTEIKREGYTIALDEPILYVDNESRGRSGHMTHAMAVWAPGKLIDFNSNCTAKRHHGHSTFGWVEYRTSEDGGETFSAVKELPFSVQSFVDGLHVISVEKAVACEDGTIAAICLQNEATTLCQPWDLPMVVTSTDGGESWSEAVPLCDYKGRVYDACTYDGVIYVLEFCNDGTGHFCGEKEEHVYRIFTSSDSGRTFSELCVVPIPSMGRGYGSMLFDSEGRLHIYAYNVNDERHMDHIVSEDGGRTWGRPDTCYLAHGIRNPQTALIDGVYILHGRAENCTGFVLYTSKDGFVWDEGTYIGDNTNYCYYSNNIVLKDPAGGNRLLIQYSESYFSECVNVYHRWLRVIR